MTTTTIQVSVTQSDIDAGEVGAARVIACPVALAVRRHLPTAWVAEQRLYTNYFDDGCYIQLPLTAQTFIRAFDAGEPVQPLVFELDVPNAD